MSVLETLTKATPARRSVTMCVDGALQSQWDALSDQLDDAVSEDANETGSLALPNTTRIVNQMEEIRERVQASEVTFVFEKMDWTRRLELQGQHPPRENVLMDRFRGCNTATFYPVLIAESCVSVTGVDGDTVSRPDIPETVWTALLGRPEQPATDAEPAVPAVAGSLNLGQIDQLIHAAQQVNEGHTMVPPSARSLLESQDSGASLAQPSPGTSAPDASTGGSRRTSRKSSTTTAGPSLGSPAGT